MSNTNTKSINFVRSRSFSGKALLLFSILIFSNEILHAQPQPTIVNERQFGGSNLDLMHAGGVADNGIFIADPFSLAGESSSDDGDLPGNSGLKDAWGALEFEGETKFSINYGGSDDDAFLNALALQAFAVIFLGYTKSPEVSSFHGGEDLYLVKVDSDGIVQHERAYGGSGNEKGVYFSPSFAGYRMAVSYGGMQADGDWTGETTFGNPDIGIMKLDFSFNVIDKKILGTTGYDLAYDAFKTDDGITILASTNSTGGSFTTSIKGGDDILVFKVDENLSLSGEYRYGGSKVEYGYDIKPHPDGGFFVAGASWSNQWFFGNDNSDVRDISCTTDAEANPNGIVFRADASGNMIWSTCLEGSDWDFAQACYFQDPDILYVVGFTASNDGDFPAGNPGSYDCFVAALDANTGEKKWLKVYGGSGADYAYDIVRLEGGNLLTVNETNSNDGDVVSVNHGMSDAWIVEFTNPTGINEPFETSEVLAYPNPSNEFVTLDLPFNEPADQIEIIRADGQVHDVLHPTQAAITLDISDYPEGLYLIRMRHHSGSYLTKFAVVK